MNGMTYRVVDGHYEGREIDQSGMRGAAPSQRQALELCRDLAVAATGCVAVPVPVFRKQPEKPQAHLLSHLANLNDEQDERVFFVFVDQVHKILNNRSDILAIARVSQHHSKPPSGNRYCIAEIFHSVAAWDKDKWWR